MLQQRTIWLSVVFFWALGWVCINPALGAEELKSLDSNEGDGEQQAISLVEDESEGEAIDETSVKVGSFGEIDLHIKDLELAKVLQLLSLQSQRNIVASRNVSGTVSADLYGVDFYEALEAILTTNGFGYREKGNFIYVYTAQELAEMEKAERKLTHRVIRLNYLTTSDAATYVAPLLSSAGSISASNDVASGFQPSVSDGGADSFALEATLIVHDYPENVDEIVAMIEELDKRPKQVVVEATILEARLDEDNSFGVDLSVVSDYSYDNFTDPLAVVDQLIGSDHILDDGSEATGSPYRDLGKGGGVQSTVGNTATGKSGFKVGIVTKHASAFLRALDSVNDTTVVATPKVVVLNRQRADLLSGAKLGYVSTTQSETSNTQTVEFLDIGVQLSLRPFVSEDNYVRMELKPSISDGSTSVVEGLVIPNTTNQEVTTNVMVYSGQTIVLGGLFKEDTTVGRNQVPILGEVPLLGAGFKGQDDTVRRSETIFLITPTVVKDEVMYELGERVADDVELVRIGARQGLLPWSRTKLTASHMRKAMAAYDEGDNKNALWWANLALSMDSTIVDARNLKAELTGEEAWTRTRSILDGAIDEMIAEQLGDDEDGEEVEMLEGQPIDPEAALQQPVEVDEPVVVEVVLEETETTVEEAAVEVVETEVEVTETETEIETVEVGEAELTETGSFQAEMLENQTAEVEVIEIDLTEAEATETQVIEIEATETEVAEVEAVQAEAVEVELTEEVVELEELQQTVWVEEAEDVESAVEEPNDQDHGEEVAETETVEEQWQTVEVESGTQWVWDDAADETEVAEDADAVEMIDLETAEFEVEEEQLQEVEISEETEAVSDELVEVEAEVVE